MKKFFKWIINLFRSRYEVTVSFNHVYGDADDRTYITKKILIQKDKHLKFKDEDNDMIEFRAATGLNYIIKELR